MPLLPNVDISDSCLSCVQSHVDSVSSNNYAITTGGKTILRGEIWKVSTEELHIAHYCHPSCKPFQNICRLPKEEAFAQAYKMAAINPDTSAFYRFAEGAQGFESYYPRRMKTDEYLYDLFVSLGGKPKERHPLSFVLQGSEWLNNWFGNGIIIKIKLIDIPSESISFTLGDSMKVVTKNGVMVNEIQHGVLTMYTKEMLLDTISQYDGTFDDFMNEVKKKYTYIEVQLWNDDYCKPYIMN